MFMIIHVCVYTRLCVYTWRVFVCICTYNRGIAHSRGHVDEGDLFVCVLVCLFGWGGGVRRECN
jgi:hypothetical protein